MAGCHRGRTDCTGVTQGSAVAMGGSCRRRLVPSPHGLAHARPAARRKGASALAAFAAAMALLREYDETDDDLDVGVLLELYMQDEDVIAQAKLLESNVLSFKNFIDEENGVGGGAIAGIGVGPQGEPGVDPRLMPMARRKKKKNGTNTK